MKNEHWMAAVFLWTVLQCGSMAYCLHAEGSIVKSGRYSPVYRADSLPMQKAGRDLTGKDANEPAVRLAFEAMAGDKRRVYSVIAWNYGIFLQLNGVYATESRVYLKILLFNRSGADYAVDTFGFFIRRNPHETGEEKLAPLSSYGMVKTIKSQGKALYIFGLPRFMLSGKEHLDIEVVEKRGGRHLRLRMGKRPLLRARLP